ncbi:response regulator [Stappia sp. ES.058]|uniref:response regulator n=1 Tax=Stappia sp. ES.058 TaxID=1881061 RepID=UPI00087B9EA7|nr:response regulator [Stappia sp. ES.058]SDU32586.1 Response regulator receiver domain-containing protein [Stappia sp. ES.058]
MTPESDTPKLKLLGAALIVEDNPIIAHDTQYILEEIGFSPVEILSNLADGLEKFASLVFSFIILDVQFSDENSLKFAERLTESGAQIILASGYGNPENLPLFLRNQAVIGKPYTKAQIEALVMSSPPHG